MGEWLGKGRQFYLEIEPNERARGLATGFTSLDSWTSFEWLQISWDYAQPTISAKARPSFTLLLSKPSHHAWYPSLIEDKAAGPLRDWLKDLEICAGIGFRYISTNDSRVKHKAIKQGLGDNVKIHLCLLHIARAWSMQIKSLGQWQ
jgi:hypothetical protein